MDGMIHSGSIKRKRKFVVPSPSVSGSPNITRHFHFDSSRLKEQERRGLAKSAAEKRIQNCWNLATSVKKSMEWNPSFPSVKLWGENPETFCQLGTKDAGEKSGEKKLDIFENLNCRQCGQWAAHFDKKSGSAGGILNKVCSLFLKKHRHRQNVTSHHSLSLL